MIFQNCLDHKLVHRINLSLVSCNTCCSFDPYVLNKSGGTFINTNSNNIDVMFIAQNPGISNAEINFMPQDIIPFGLSEENHYHYFFDNFYERFVDNFQREPVFYITNTIKCITEKNLLPMQLTVDKCYNKYLRREILFFDIVFERTYLIILLGLLSKTIQNKKFINKRNPLLLPHPGFMNRKGNWFVQQNVEKIIDRLKKGNII